MKFFKKIKKEDALFVIRIVIMILRTYFVF